MNQSINISITTTTRRRKLKGGAVASYRQWYVNFRDPKTGKRIRRAKDRKKDAEAYKAELLRKFAQGSYVDERTAPTVGQAVDHWLADKNGKVKPSTLKGYKVVVNGAIRGPLLIGTRQERADYTESGIAPKGARFIKLLGDVKLPDVTTADDPHLAPHHRRAVRHLHGEPGEEPPQVNPGARRGGLHRPRAVDADRAVSRPAQAEEGDPNVGRHPPADRRRQG